MKTRNACDPFGQSAKVFNFGIALSKRKQPRRRINGYVVIKNLTISVQYKVGGGGGIPPPPTQPPYFQAGFLDINLVTTSPFILLLDYFLHAFKC